jgi:hypothetical protein
MAPAGWASAEFIRGKSMDVPELGCIIQRLSPEKRR